MIEHRLIEKMINILKNELEEYRNTQVIDPVFVNIAVDFIRTYADATHHGKEEDILFRELKHKKISEEHQRIMDELVEEHKFGRTTVGKLVQANSKYLQGIDGSVDEVISQLQVLVDFYPTHIDKEDNHFFKPVMKYFTQEEQHAMLLEGQVYDRKMIHRKYEQVIERIATDRNYQTKQLLQNWLDFM